MPPLNLLPNQPAGMPDWYSPSGPPLSSTNTSSGSQRPRFVNTANGPMTLPSDWSQDEADSWVKSYDQHIATLTQAWQQSSGLQRKQIEAQIEDARQGRENAMKIAQLQAQTSRYGIDQQTKVAMEQLKENQRQFDARQGMDRAKTGTEYLSTPDRFFQAADFLNMSSRALTGQRGPGAYAANGAPTPKTMADFDALVGGGGAYQSSGGAQTNNRHVDPGQAAAAGGAGADARVKALKSVIDAVPPSTGDGMDNNDYAVLQAAKALYSTNLQPGTLERMRPGQRAILQSAGRRLGYDVNDWEANYVRSGVGQGAANRA